MWMSPLFTYDKSRHRPCVQISILCHMILLASLLSPLINRNKMRVTQTSVKSLSFPRRNFDSPSVKANIQIYLRICWPYCKIFSDLLSYKATLSSTSPNPVLCSPVNSSLKKKTLSCLTLRHSQIYGPTCPAMLSLHLQNPV